MDSWDEDLQENHVVVRYKDNESILVKVSSQTTVSQVLSRVCEKWNLQPEKHILRYHTEELLESDRNIGISIPPNSTLHVVESSAERDLTLSEESVIVSLQIEGTVFRKPFEKTDSVSQVLNDLYEASSQTFPRKEMKPRTVRSASGKRVNTNCKVTLGKNEKLLILLPTGAVTLDQSEFDNTMLCDFSHEGHIFLTFMIDDLEDVPLLEDDQDEVLQCSQDENSLNFSSQDKCKQEIYEESQPSVAKIKHLLTDGTSQKGTDEKMFGLSDSPLKEDELFERHGLVYKLSYANSSSSEVLEIKTHGQSSGIYTKTWISVCFQDNLALQASFSPFEYVYDIKAYVKKFLINPTLDFQLSSGLDEPALDEKANIFLSGLVPSAKLYFTPVVPENSEDTEIKYQQKSLADVQNNSIDPKFTSKVVTELAAGATALSFSQATPNITIQSEVYRPKTDETTWEKLKITTSK